MRPEAVFVLMLLSFILGVLVPRKQKVTVVTKADTHESDKHDQWWRKGEEPPEWGE